MDFETVLVRKMILDRGFFNKVLTSLEPEYFKTPGFAHALKLMKDYYGQYRDCPSVADLVTLIKDVPNAEVRKSISDAVKSTLQVQDTEVANTPFLLDETLKWIRECLYFQALSLGAEGLQKKDEALQKKAQEILDKREKVNFDTDDALEFGNVDLMIEYFKTRNRGILTKHKEINKRLGTGFLPCTLNVVLAPMGIGKSLLMCDIAAGMLTDGFNVLIVSLEMSDTETMKRIYANILDVSINTFADLSKTPEEKQALDHTPLEEADVRAKHSATYAQRLGKLFIKAYPTGTFSSANLQELLDRYRLEKEVKFDCVIVDYLGIMKSDLKPRNTSTYEYIKSVGEELRSVAVKEQVIVISASQLHRAAVNKDNADNSDIADSIATAMTADWMCFILQTEQMKEESRVKCKVTKNRYNGRTDTFDMGVDYEKMRFVDLVQTPQSQNAPIIPAVAPAPTLNIQAPTKPDDFTISVPEDPPKNVDDVMHNDHNDLDIDDLLADVLNV